MQGYEAASQDLVYFRPVEQNDMDGIKKLEVGFWLSVNLGPVVETAGCNARAKVGPASPQQ